MDNRKPVYIIRLYGKCLSVVANVVGNGYFDDPKKALDTAVSIATDGNTSVSYETGAGISIRDIKEISHADALSKLMTGLVVFINRTSHTDTVSYVMVEKLLPI
jgi:hypothetical protein